MLGAAAGGGFPQWNSNAAACRRARAGDPDCASQTQASLAVSADRVNWFLLNASPDLRQQIAQTPALHPTHDLRSTPIAGVVLTGAEVDTIAGLLSMRERQAFRLHATAPVLDLLAANPIFAALAPDVVTRIAERRDESFALRLPDGRGSGLQATLFAIPGKVPLYMEDQAGSDPVAETDDSAGVAITDGRRTLFYIPGCAAVTPSLQARLRNADLVFFDGTLWHDEEMIDAGLGPKTGRRMGHMSVVGPEGTMAAFADLGVKRKFFIHINNSNPLLDARTPQRATVAAAGWEVAHDGLELQL